MTENSVKILYYFKVAVLSTFNQLYQCLPYTSILKGQSNEIFFLRFFHQSAPSGPIRDVLHISTFLTWTMAYPTGIPYFAEAPCSPTLTLKHPVSLQLIRDIGTLPVNIIKKNCQTNIIWRHPARLYSFEIPC